MKVILQENRLRRFASELLTASGSARKDAEEVAGALVWADKRGRYAQGVFRIPVLATMLKKDLISSPARMRWRESAPSIAHLDAGNGFGQIAGARAMRRGIEIAKETGIGFVAVNNSNHYGAASYYCAMAAEAGCLGITFANATPKVAPYGGTKAIFGTNPVAFGCPTSSGTPILVDFSTSAIAGSTIRNINESGGRLPEGVALDESGRPTTDPAALQTGSLLPIAGPKGYGLGMMVEIFCGILAGAGMSHEVGPYYSTWKRRVNSGHIFIAIDISALQPAAEYFGRLDELIREIKSSPRQEGFEEILIPGEIRGRFAEKTSQGIPLTEETVRLLEEHAQRVGCEIPWKVADHTYS